MLALLISFVRARKARKIYSLIGGRSPILENTQIQAEALEKSLKKDFDVVVVPIMRYWHPRAKEALSVLEKFNPDKIVFFPLYPQFSTTTTQSLVEEWESVASKWVLKTRVVHDFFSEPNFIRTHQELIKPTLQEASLCAPPRILFSAHGLPKKVIEDGDPYQKQTETSVALIMKKFKGVDFSVCYQSRVGPLEWIGPSLGEELKRAARDRVAVVVVPISFVSDHSETLVELDIDYAKKAKDWGISFYGRVPVLGSNPLFIKCLEEQVRFSVEKTFIQGQNH